MPQTNKVEGPASSFSSIEETCGRSIDEWMKVLDGIREARRGRMAALKSQYRVGHGHANALVAHHGATAAQ